MDLTTAAHNKCEISTHSFSEVVLSDSDIDVSQLSLE